MHTFVERIYDFYVLSWKCYIRRQLACLPNVLKQINRCTEGICLHEILCDKMETPKKRKRIFTLEFNINVINAPTVSE